MPLFLMKFKERTIMTLADMICGNFDTKKSFFVYRSSSALSRFFRDCDTDYVHDGSTRNHWVADALRQILAEPHPNAQTPPDTFCRLVKVLMDPADAFNEEADRPGALVLLNTSLGREGFVAFYGEDKQCYLRHIPTNTLASVATNPHRPFSASEQKRREELLSYLLSASEDDLTQEVLLPLFRQLGFHRITASGHKDKALEYGKDVWMKFMLPTQHVLYFGIQIKKDKIDAAGTSKQETANIAEVYNQVSMMLGHEIFDPEVGRRVLVDHAFIVASGEITKAARNWIGNKLDALKRSQLLFMERDDIVNLYVVSNLPPPKKGKSASSEDDFPF